MTEALVTPSVMSWARRRRGLAPSELAAKLNVRPEGIAAWEAGERRPTFRQAQKFAQVLHVPFGYLYLPEPPGQELPIPDFRTLPGQPSREPSPDLLDLLTDVLGKQEWFRDYQESEGIEELPFVGRFKPSDPMEAVARDIREVLDVDRARSRATTRDMFLGELTRNAEQAGVMVMRSGVVGNNPHRPLDVDEFRGFSVSDHTAPLVFINIRDASGAQVFTMMHEMAHIWTGQGGISSPDYGLRFLAQESPIERFCDRVAAETLVPGQEFQERWRPGQGAVAEKVERLTHYYKVSAMVILRQAHDYDFIPTPVYWEHYNQLVKQARGSSSEGKSGGNFYYTLIARNGGPFTQSVISRAASGTLFLSEAADLLGVKAKTLPGVAKHVFGSSFTFD